MQIRLVNIRADEIVDGNTKLTLGLVWTIILHFQVGLSVCVSRGFNRLRCAKTAERIEVQFRVKSPEGLTSIVLDGGPDSPRRGGGGSTLDATFAKLLWHVVGMPVHLSKVYLCISRSLGQGQGNGSRIITEGSLHLKWAKAFRVTISKFHENLTVCS